MNIKFLGMFLVSLAFASSVVLTGCNEKTEAPATEPVAVEEVAPEMGTETTGEMAPTPEAEKVAEGEAAPATEHTE
ncbi:MAG: hypothetical protein HEQ32_00385 [Vampirovibrio sp.]|jgi:hypothetical protein